MLEIEKIYEPLLKKISGSYLAQRDSYREIAIIVKKQSQIKSQKEIYIFTELAGEKEIIFQEIAERNNFLKKAKNDIAKSLKIEEFTISALKEKLQTPVIEELLNALKEAGDGIQELEIAEKENEENLKKILNLS